jgi:hypothetical protein
MTFQQAVQATASVQAYYRRGLQALPNNYAKRIECANTQQLTGSINVDEALRATEPNSPRWDYGIGLSRKSAESAIWVEVHPASSTGVTDMLAKLQWLRNWLRAKAPALDALTQSDYYWVSTDATIAITPNSPQARRLAAAGLRGPKRVLPLP